MGAVGTPRGWGFISMYPAKGNGQWSRLKETARHWSSQELRGSFTRCSSCFSSYYWDHYFDLPSAMTKTAIKNIYLVAWDKQDKQFSYQPCSEPKTIPRPALAFQGNDFSQVPRVTCSICFISVRLKGYFFLPDHRGETGNDAKL